MPGFESATQAFPFPSTEIFFFPAGQVFSCFTCCCDSWERGRCSVFCFYLCLHTFNWFCLIMQRCVRQSSCKPHFFHVEFEFSFNNLQIWICFSLHQWTLFSSSAITPAIPLPYISLCMQAAIALSDVCSFLVVILALRFACLSLSGMLH